MPHLFEPFVQRKQAGSVVARQACSVLAAVSMAASPLSAAAAGNGFEVVHHFTGKETGSNPNGSLIQGKDGRLYGTARFGGAHPTRGAVFSVSTSGDVSLLHSFRRGHKGSNPVVGLALSADGEWYGTTTGGGINGNGVVFKLTKGGKFKLLHDFSYSLDGVDRQGILLWDDDGHVYGSTGLGPDGICCGTVFRVSPEGAYEIVHLFSSNEGAYPSALIKARDGNFYGTTTYNGAHGGGTVFRMTPTGVVEVLHHFAGGKDDGYSPMWGGVFQAADGHLYGATDSGGATNDGTAYRVTLNGTFTLLHSFGASASDGRRPYSALMQADNDSLYGTTLGGGQAGLGTIYRIRPDGQLSIVHDFDVAGGNNTTDAVMQASDGLIYGTTREGGNSGLGTLFRIKAK